MAKEKKEKKDKKDKSREKKSDRKKSKKHHKEVTEDKAKHHASTGPADPGLKLIFNHETQKFEYVKGSESKDLNPDKEEKVWTPKEACESLLKKYPAIKSDLINLADGIQVRGGADISELADKGLRKRLARLFRSLGLRENAEGGQLSLPKRMRKDDLGSKVRSLVHEILLEEGSDPNDIAHATSKVQDQDAIQSGDAEDREIQESGVSVGPARPTAEQIKVMQEAAEAGHPETSDEEDDDDEELGPPPPELVRDADLASDPARNAEVQRILDTSTEKDNDPFEIFGLPESATAAEIKKRFWKLSLMVHPDKCTHKLAKDAFDILKKAKEILDDTSKRSQAKEKRDDKKLQQQVALEMKKRQEKAAWARARGESVPEDLEPPKKLVRESWMTSPGEKPKNKMPTQQTQFSRHG